jgi:uncharacterized protein
MTVVFADTSYWIASFLPGDQLHEAADRAATACAGRLLVTSEFVLTELLNDFSGRGQHFRAFAADLVRDLRAAELTRVVPVSDELFEAALTLYEGRPDKKWSLTDCSSMVICERERIKDVLTHDRHFVQAGFNALLRSG